MTKAMAKKQLFIVILYSSSLLAPLKSRRAMRQWLLSNEKFQSYYGKKGNNFMRIKKGCLVYYNGLIKGGCYSNITKSNT